MCLWGVGRPRLGALGSKRAVTFQGSRGPARPSAGLSSSGLLTHPSLCFLLMKQDQRGRAPRASRWACVTQDTCLPPRSWIPGGRDPSMPCVCPPRASRAASLTSPASPPFPVGSPGDHGAGCCQPGVERPEETECPWMRKHGPARLKQGLSWGHVFIIKSRGTNAGDCLGARHAPL